jgi:hypothetical protein
VATVQDPTDTSGRWIAASKVNDTSVYNTAGDKLGSVYDVMLNKISGQAEYALMSFGGFLGIGEKYHPLPWRELKYDTSLGGYVVGLSRERLESAPAYSVEEMARWDDTWDRRIGDYYGTGSGTRTGMP